MGTVVFGHERNQASVLVELKPPYAIDPKNERDLITMRNTLWYLRFNLLPSPSPIIDKGLSFL